MDIILTTQEKSDLEIQHKKERDRRVADRIKAVLLCSEGWNQVQISQALRIHPETVHQHLDDYNNSKKLKPENGGSKGHLTLAQASELIPHLESTTYVKASDICAYVQEKYQVEFSESRMKHWHYRQEFSYKKPKGTPSKADPEKQQKFVEYYEDLLNTLPEDEPVEFGDGVQPHNGNKSDLWLDQERSDKDHTNNGFTYTNESDGLH